MEVSFQKKYAKEIKIFCYGCCFAIVSIMAGLFLGFLSYDE